MADSICVSVRTLDNMDTFWLEVDSLDTVASVKAVIQTRTHVAADHQLLIFGRLTLADSKTLADYAVGQGCVLHSADAREVQVPVVIGLGRILSVAAAPSLRVRTFKARITAAAGLGTNDRHLLFEGQVLVDNELLETYKIDGHVYLVRATKACVGKRGAWQQPGLAMLAPAADCSHAGCQTADRQWENLAAGKRYRFNCWPYHAGARSMVAERLQVWILCLFETWTRKAMLVAVFACTTISSSSNRNIKKHN